MTNLLRGGDFETDWSPEKSHRAIAIVGGVPQERAIENIFTPAGWLTWFVHKPDVWDQPEVRDAWIHHDPRRVHSGRKGTLLFTFYRKHDAGFLQQVSVTPGQRLRLTAFAHAWSNHDAEWCTHVDDGAWSTGIGRDGVAAIEGAFPLTGTPSSDARSNFLFAVGIDPAGGINPLADTVEWGQAWHIYNEYHPLTVEAVAQAQTVTVFLRSRTLYGFKHNDAYWDDVTLEVIGDQPTPPSGGLPRIQYKRVVNVVPEGAGVARALEVLGLVWPQTVTNSYDDAGVGALKKKTAVLWDIPAKERSAFVDFYGQFYPGTVVEFDGDDEPPVVTPPEQFLLWQRNPLWANEKLAGRNCTATIGAQGCWVACCAMAQRFLSIDRAATPSTANKLLGPDGFSECRTNWSAMKRLGLEVVKRTSSDGEVIDWVQAQAETVAFVRVYLPGEHWLLVYDYDDVADDYCVADPWKNATGYLEDLYPAGPWENGETEAFRLVRKLNATPPPTEPPAHAKPHELFGLHLQNGYRGDMEFIADAQPSVVKLVGNFEKSRTIKANSPNTLVVARWHTNNQEPYYNHPDGADAGAAAFYANWGDALEANAEYIDYAESLNEEIGTHAIDKLRKVVAFDVAWCKLLESKGFPARPLVLTAAIGNPDHGEETRMMIPAAREAARCGGAAGYHAYLGYNWERQYAEIDDDGEAIHFSMRALWSWDPEFVKAGVYVDYIFSESGPIYLAGSGPGTWHCPDPEGGWRGNHCMNGSFETFMRVWLRARERWAAWNATHGNRLLGAAVFTLGGPGFSNFEYGPELPRIAAALRANPV